MHHASPHAVPATQSTFQALPSFKEHPDQGYRGRTVVNASADLTIAIAADMTTAGERLTKRAVLEQGRIYCPIQYRGKPATPAAAQAIRHAIRSIDKPEITINIAGNGLYTLNEKWAVEQEDLDRYTFELLQAAIGDSCGKKISLIRSGGQTGFDEAGIKAGMSLRIPTEILAPQGWKFRDVRGVDVCDEHMFKERFVRHHMKLDYHSQSIDWSYYGFDNDDECNGLDTYGFVRNRAGKLAMEHLSQELENELRTSVHAYFSYIMVVIDVQGCSGCRDLFQVTFQLKDALESINGQSLEATRKLIEETR